MLTFFDWFAGIGGFRLGLERAGMTCVGACEIDRYARMVYAKNFGHAPMFGDIRTVNPDDVPDAHVWTAGFPCQDISAAGRGEGIDGKSSGLWWDFFRLLERCRPPMVILENSPLLASRGLDRILSAVAPLGYDAEWSIVAGHQLGAPHARERMWVVLYPSIVRADDCLECDDCGELACPFCGGHYGTDCYHPGPSSEDRSLPDTHRERREERRGGRAVQTQHGPPQCARQAGRPTGASPWPPPPKLGRMVHGLSDRVDRLRCLGNAVLPCVVEWIGRRIVAAFDQQEEPCKSPGS